MKNITFKQLKKIIKESSEIDDARRNRLYYAVGYYGYSNDEYDVLITSKNLQEVIETAKEDFEEGYFDCINVCRPDGTIVKSFGNTGGFGYEGGDYYGEY
jgi:hypothetical protein